MSIKILFLIFMGIACGLAVGAGFVAFITVLGIIPRLIQLTKTSKFLIAYEGAVVLGVLCGSLFSLLEPQFHVYAYILIILGSFYGVFVGMLAAALTEVLNVFPLITKRIRLHEKIIYLLMALAFGKIVGSLFHWLYFVNL